MPVHPYPDVPAAFLAAVLGAPLRSVRRWRARSALPDAYARLWRLATDPDLGHFDEAWRGFKLRGGLLHVPEGWTVSPGDVRALPLLLQLQSEVRRQRSAAVQYLLEL